MKKIAVCCLVLLFACERKPFVEHKVTMENAGSCAAIQGYFRLESNFGGERFSFQKCLPARITKEDVISSRHGDTVVVSFKQSNPGATALFNVTLDIDSYPKYHFVEIDGEVYSIGQSSK